MRTAVAFAVLQFVLSAWLCTSFTAAGYESEATSSRWLESAKSAGCRSLVIVSTMDGRITVLDPDRGGLQLWSLEPDQTPLLQSSLNNIEIISNGMSYRILPSLDGSLYMLNDVGARGIPINVETLLSSSTKIGSDIFVGSKDVITYGVDSITGKVYYSCSSMGCEKHATAHHEEKLIIRRISQIVRGVDVNTGNEKWNVSVGEHQIFLTNAQDTISSCEEELNTDDYQVKVIPPDGVVFGVSKHVDSQLLWRQKLRSPVAKIWKLDNTGLHELSLFDADIVPPLQTRLLQAKDQENMSAAKSSSSLSSMIYVGNYGGDHYVIPSPEEKKALQLYNKGHPPAVVYPLPYSDRLYTLPLLTAEHQGCGSGVPCLMCSASEVVELFENPEKDSGWYVFSPAAPSSALQKWNRWDYLSAAADSYQRYMTQLMLVDAWEWWKHAVLMCVTLIFVPQIFIFLFIFRRRREPAQPMPPVRSAPPPPLPLPVKRKSQESMTELTPTFATGAEPDFTSRFLKDFVPIRCLGCGGFGTVFESLNKVDEQKYAVKRIPLPNRDYAKEKVIREVRALAKLDHPGIVRYYNSWFEEPPSEWLTSPEASVFDCQEFSDTAESDLLHRYSNGGLNLKNVQAKHRVSLNFTLSSLRAPPRDGEDSLDIVFEHDGLAPDSTNEAKMTDVHNDPAATTDNSSGTVFLFIQMQLCREYTLMDWLNEHQQSRDQSVMVDWFRQIVEAMMYVHECDIIHRDLKPTNIFFSLTGQIKIGDFGLAKHSLPCGQCIDDSEVNKTVVAHHSHTQNVGTYLYMSPEQETNTPYTFKIDIYAIGLIFVELMIPFATQMERIVTLKNLRALKLPELMQRSSAACELLLGALSHDPDQRPSCKAILTSAIFSSDPL